MPAPAVPADRTSGPRAWWTQDSGRDWTLLAFLGASGHRGGIGLDVAEDAETLDALARAVVPLAVTPVELLRGRRLEADDFHALLSPDPVRDVLLWLNEADPQAPAAGWGQERWAAFCAQCADKLDMRPEEDGTLGAAKRLGERSGVWRAVWDRFAEAPAAYPNVVEALRAAATACGGSPATGRSYAASS